MGVNQSRAPRTKVLLAGQTTLNSEDPDQEGGALIEVEGKEAGLGWRREGRAQAFLAHQCSLLCTGAPRWGEHHFPVHVPWYRLYGLKEGVNICYPPPRGAPVWVCPPGAGPTCNFTEDSHMLAMAQLSFSDWPALIYLKACCEGSEPWSVVSQRQN